MINLRYHIVSLTAVFLALAIGVLLGGTYLDKYTVDQLDQSITNAEERIRETRAENDRLRGEVGDAQARNAVNIRSVIAREPRGQKREDVTDGVNRIVIKVRRARLRWNERRDMKLLHRAGFE